MDSERRINTDNITRGGDRILRCFESAPCFQINSGDTNSKNTNLNYPGLHTNCKFFFKRPRFALRPGMLRCERRSDGLVLYYDVNIDTYKIEAYRKRLSRHLDLKISYNI